LQSEQQYSNLVYEFFLARIQFRYYQYGDYLPSIETLCRELSVSAQTVKIALKRLRAEGYIDMHNGRSTKIIFRQDPTQAEQERLRYFSRRVRGFQDLYQCATFIYIPLLTEGFRRAGQRDLAYLAGLARGSGTEDVLHFFCYILQLIDNPLAMNLYWETSIYWGLLFLRREKGTVLCDVDLMHDDMKRCLSLAEAKEWTRLYEQLIIFQKNSVGKALDALEEAIPPAPDEEQVPFVWRIYRDRPQVCYSLAACLLHDIYLGSYQETSFLPSYEKMAELYDVSVSTVRRTVKVLNQLGAARSINGTGTRIFGIGEPCESPDFSSPAVRRNLSFFVQSYELLFYSCEMVMRDTLSSVTCEQQDQLLRQLEEDLAAGRCELSLWQCLLFITRHSRLKGIREIYGRIYSLFLWGYPLKASRQSSPRSDQAILRFSRSMIRSLKKNDIEGCVKAIKALVTRQFPPVEPYLLSHGLKPEELRLSPSIRLLITEDI